VKLKALAGQKVIGFEPDIPTRKALDKILKEYDVEVKHVMEFDNVETVKRAVEIDAGISIVPQGTVLQEIAKQTLAAVEIDDGEFFLPSFPPLAAILQERGRANKVLSPAMKQFLAILKNKDVPSGCELRRTSVRNESAGCPECAGSAQSEWRDARKSAIRATLPKRQGSDGTKTNNHALR
jgi:hypothetical protein